MHFMDKRLEEKLPGTPAYYEKRKKDAQNNEVHLINQRLQRLAHHTPVNFIKEHEALQKALQKANRQVTQSTILRLMYRNNFENLQVAVATTEFLLMAMPHLPEDKQQKIRHSLKGILHDLKRMDPVGTKHLHIGR